MRVVAYRILVAPQLFELVLEDFLRTVRLPLLEPSHKGESQLRAIPLTSVTAVGMPRRSDIQQKRS